MEWTIQQLADSAGITSRTLRHYDEIGLLPPARVGHNGYRFYDTDSVARLQRILLLRELGLSLPTIAEILDRPSEQAPTDAEDTALLAHLRFLEAERARIDDRIGALRHTLDTRAGAEGSLQMMLEGFNDPYRDEVIARWGEAAFEASNQWWHAKSLQQQREWKRDLDDMIATWITTWKSGHTPDSTPAQSQAARHIAWFRTIPGTPLADGDRARSIAMVTAMADLYADDPRYAAAYGNPNCAAFVRGSLKEYVRNSL
ncbi:MerR family transcriptional regulator [Nocardia tengchongensis]|uniref:MerR family transcriptional regulator n=1 Tax=Nocardia tengchongensis TaxID=2055889 RepID=UPI00367D4F6B